MLASSNVFPALFHDRSLLHRVISRAQPGADCRAVTFSE